MSERVVLTPRAPLERAIEMDALAPHRLAELGEREIAGLQVWDGREPRELGELFAVNGERSASVRVEGDLSRVDGLGAGMAGGELVIGGSVGRYVGTRMTGGTIRVMGNAGDGAGLEMGGGTIEIAGDAGDAVGASALGASKGMLGGEIIVRGSAGAGVGARMRRGTIACGRVGARAGEAMIAGNILVLGDWGADPGRWNKRGSLVALGAVPLPPSYRYDCTYRPPHLALLLTYLRTRYGLAIDDAPVRGRWRRYSGDLGELGKGEILQWERGE